jgi:transglutaminase-like putative cysteine protease
VTTCDSVIKMKRKKSFELSFFTVVFFLGFSLLWAAEVKDKKSDESWMGVYIEGVKVGYSYSCTESFFKEDKKYSKMYSETNLRVTRLGGNPVEIMTVQESLYDDKECPVEMVVRTKMSEEETVIRACISPESILFEMGGRTVKEIPNEKPFYLEVPFKEWIKENRFKKGSIFDFHILDPVAYSVSECRYEVLGKENIRILGKDYELWHTRSELTSLIPVVAEEWIDDLGDIYKSEIRTGLLNTISLKMSRQEALERADRTVDIAYSTVIRPDKELKNPREIRSMTMELSGLSEEKINSFPWDSRSQKRVGRKGNSFIIQTESVIFDKEKAVPFPVRKEELKSSLEPTLFCQSDDPDMRAAAERIVGEEKNSWRAAEKIAAWVRREVTPNYNVGFASAKETLKNREGDCSEHTVLFTALCRSIGIPARASVGIMYGGSFFAYHMWPEVYVGEWVDLDPKWFCVDPKTGAYYTDATHIKFGRIELDENLFREMVLSASEIIGKIGIRIIKYK